MKYKGEPNLCGSTTRKKTYFVFLSEKYQIISLILAVIGMIGIDEGGNVAAGTSTNGASHKIQG